LCQRGDRTVRQVNQDFDLTETAVREWVKQAEPDTGTHSDGLTSDERDELAQLRRENRRLREDVDILKRATLPRTVEATHARDARASAVQVSATGLSRRLGPAQARGREVKRPTGRPDRW
jgi:transposase-like protein